VVYDLAKEQTEIEDHEQDGLIDGARSTQTSTARLPDAMVLPRGTADVGTPGFCDSNMTIQISPENLRTFKKNIGGPG
jgi:hypothetical protein